LMGIYPATLQCCVTWRWSVNRGISASECGNDKNS